MIGATLVDGPTIHRHGVVFALPTVMPHHAIGWYAAETLKEAARARLASLGM